MSYTYGGWLSFKPLTLTFLPASAILMPEAPGGRTAYFCRLVSYAFGCSLLALAYGIMPTTKGIALDLDLLSGCMGWSMTNYQ